MIKCSLLLLGGAALLTACGNQDPAEPEPIAAHTTKQLMATIVEPQARRFWNSSGSVSDETGVHDLAPTTDEGWLATQSAAATITEMGNLLMTPQYATGRNRDWMIFAQGLAKVGVQAEKAAAERNKDALLEVGGNMYNVCSACHEVYLPPEKAEAGVARPVPLTDAAKPPK